MLGRRGRRGAPAIAALVLAALGCGGRPSSDDHPRTEPAKKRGRAVAVLDLSAGLPEQDKGGLFGGGGKRSFDELHRVATAIRDDEGDGSAGVLVKLGSASFGAARAEEVGELLAAIKETRKVYCQADTLGNATLMATARGCSSIWISPAGGVEAIGIAGQVVYFRRLLAEELHLSIDMLQVGRFKGAEEPFTRDGPSPEARASLTSVLKDVRQAWLETLGAHRPRATADVVEDGPWTPERAKELGLVDEVGYADDALAAVRKESGAVRERVAFGAGADDGDGAGLDDVVRALAGDGSTPGPLALVRATGSISMSGGGGVLGGRGGITERDLGKTLAKLERDDDVKAVVLRIDSPGGSALASDLLWHQLMKLRKKKPLVVSVGDMAASGGYYLACAGDFIFAEATSIVGSIGVVGGKIGGGDALERVGVHAETFAASDRPGAANRAAYESPLVKWDEPTKARVLESMTGVYDLFLSRIVEGRSTRGRSIAKETIAESAEGRIFAGRAAKERGLIDEIGGLGAALARARELAKLDDRARIAVIGGKGGLFDSLDPAGVEERAVATVASPLATLERIAPDVVPFVGGLAPLWEGERAVVAVPFVLMVR